MLLAFPDAVNPSRTAQTVFPYLRFLFAGIFIIHELSKIIKENNVKEYKKIYDSL